MDLSSLLLALRQGPPRRLAVLGDVILDRYIWGEVDRISPEAPVPVLDLKEETYILGGASNVASNIRTLGAQVDVIGVCGDDLERDRLLTLFGEKGIGSGSLVATPTRPTTCKTRVIGHNQQIVRVDREVRRPLEPELVDRLLAEIDRLVPEVDAMVVSDYGKGVIIPAVLDHLRRRANDRNLAVVVDPKNPDFSVYRGFTVLSPNQGEAAMGAGFKIQDELSLVEAGYKIRASLGLEGVLITRGAAGMSVFIKGRDVIHIPTRARNVFDVTGAGDTVVAVLALGLAHGFGLDPCAHLANYAAGVAVGKVGTATVTLDEIVRAIDLDTPR